MIFIPLSYYAFSGLVNFITAISIAFMVLYKNPKIPTNRIFSFFSFSVAFWSFFYFIWLLTSDKNLAEFYFRTCMIGVFYMPSLFIHFVDNLLMIKRDKKFYAINYLLSIAFTLTVYSSLYGYKPEQYLMFPYWLRPGIVFHFAITHFGVIVIYSFYLLHRAVKNAKGIYKNQILYVYLGTGIGYMAGSTNYFCWYRISIPPFLNIFVSLYVAFVAYAIIKHHLMDIRLAAGKMGIALSVYSIACGIPFVLYSLIHTKLAPLATFAVLCGIAPYVISMLEDKFKHRIYRDEFARQELLTLAGKTTIEITEMDTLTDWAVKTVCNLQDISASYLFLDRPAKQKCVLHAGWPNTIPRGLLGFGYDDAIVHCFAQPCPLLKEKKEGGTRYRNVITLSDIEQSLKLAGITSEMKKRMRYLAKDLNNLKAQAAVALRFKQKLLGLLILGDKKNGKMYTPEDLDTLVRFAEDIAAAVRNIHLYDELKDAQAKLIQEEKWATLGRLGTSTKHELGTPVAIINMYTQNLLLKLKDQHKKSQPLETFAKDIQTIHDQASRIINVIQIIHQLPKEAQEKMGPLRLDDIIDKSFELATFQTYWENLGGTEVERRWPKDLPPIKGNMVHLQGTFLNLIINSYQAMEKIDSEKRKITIEAGVDPYQSKYIQIRFSDTGGGIPDDHLEKIFEYQYTTKGKGLGMGLFLCKYFVEKIHNGTISVENIPGKGVCFIIDLPVWEGPL
ncbi:MAG: hypothetical protein JW844_06000 [Candidatus Omnitrophica bacterium]|nr:hypothetical protein [Candidatus Omnitrophota bacterium]